MHADLLAWFGNYKSDWLMGAGPCNIRSLKRRPIRYWIGPERVVDRLRDRLGTPAPNRTPREEFCRLSTFVMFHGHTGDAELTTEAMNRRLREASRH